MGYAGATAVDTGNVCALFNAVSPNSLSMATIPYPLQFRRDSPCPLEQSHQRVGTTLDLSWTNFPSTFQLNPDGLSQMYILLSDPLSDSRA